MKKTNTFKRFAAITSASILAACMVAPMAMTSNAAVITVKQDATYGDVETHTYTAYQIFTGTYNDNGLKVTGWGTGIDSTSLLADTEFKAIIGTATEPAAVAQEIEKITESTAKDNLAAIIAKYTNASGTPIVSGTTDLAVGYYIVKDAYTDTDNKADALSKFILKVATNNAIEITPKKSYPSVVKKVKENKTIDGLAYKSDANYNDVADYSIGETIPFKLYGQLPSSFDGYESYYIKFTDTLGEQFDLLSATGEFVVKIGNTQVDLEKSKYNIHISNSNNTIVIEIEDVLNLKDANGEKIACPAGSVVTVEYNAKLNSNAVIGLDGQINTVDLTYSNNPNEEYKPITDKPNSSTEEGGDENDTEDVIEDTDKTKPDTVIVFTYELDVTKNDGDTDKPLANAVFKVADAQENGKYASFDVKTRTFTVGEDEVTETYYEFAGWSAEGTTITTPADGIFRIVGIDEGTYWLEETDAPENYNILENRVKLEIVANTLDGDDDDRNAWDSFDPDEALTELTLSVDGGTAKAGNINTGAVATIVENNKGTSLPETGGIGTTLFYLGGGAMVAVAGVYLISKKRMKNAE